MKKRNLLLIVSFIFAINLTSFSQENAVKNKNERSHKGDILYQYFTNSQYAIDNGKYKEAIDLLMDLNKLVPGDANVLYNIGQAYIDYPIYPDEKAKAIPYLEKCLNGVSLYHEGGFNDTTAPLHAFYSLAEAYIAANRVEDAIEVNKKFHNYVEEWWGPAFYSDLKKEDLIDEAEKQKEVCNNALKFMANPLNVKIKNIGIPISSKYHDYNAFISPDNKTIMYTSKNIVDTTNNITSKEIGDTLINCIYYSQFDTVKKRWLPGAPLFENKLKNIAIVGLTYDGKDMLIYKSDVGMGDLYTSTFENGSWSTPVSLGNEINGPHSCESHACFSLDKKTIYFSSNRKGGLGGYDIWYSTKTSDGKWSKPINMGPTINTKYDEVAPLLSIDGKTLYFSSEGFESMGGLDIFKSTIDASNNCSTPINMGYPINTTDDNIFMSMSADNVYAYVSQRSDSSYGGLDIYQITFLENVKQLAIEGDVKAADTKKPLKANVTIIASNQKDTISFIKNNELTGDFNITVPYNLEKVYISAVSNNNYHPFTKEIIVSEEKKGDVITEHIELTPFTAEEIAKNAEVNSQKILDKKETIVLKNIYFVYNKTIIIDESKPELNKILKFLTNNPTVRIEISGHCDSIGSASYNKTLSLKRAKAIVDYLVNKGISSKRLEYKGYGKEKPIAPNATPEGRQLNRRTEMKIIGIQ